MLAIFSHVCNRYNAPTMSPLSEFPTSNNLLPSSPYALAPIANLIGLVAAVWAIGLASVVLIFTPAACRFYRPQLAQQ